MKTTTDSEFNAGQAAGQADRETWDNPPTDQPFARRLVADNKRKAALGATAPAPAQRAYWLGWLAGFNID